MLGANVLFKVWAITQGTDDTQGGAVITGSVTETCLWGSFAEDSPSTLLLEQGLETTKLASVLLPAWNHGTLVTILERDHIEVVGPNSHPYLGNHYRVLAVQRTPMHTLDRRGIMKLRVTRIDKNRAEEWM
jgi:hypothetical protein